MNEDVYIDVDPVEDLSDDEIADDLLCFDIESLNIEFVGAGMI